jgi:hypothetical protein
LSGDLVQHGLISLGDAELAELERVGYLALEPAHEAELALNVGALLELELGLGLVVPEVGVAGQLI